MCRIVSLSPPRGGGLFNALEWLIKLSKVLCIWATQGAAAFCLLPHALLSQPRTRFGHLAGATHVARHAGVYSSRGKARVGNPDSGVSLVMFMLATDTHTHTHRLLFCKRWHLRYGKVRWQKRHRHDKDRNKATSGKTDQTYINRTRGGMIFNGKEGRGETGVKGWERGVKGGFRW